MDLENLVREMEIAFPAFPIPNENTITHTGDSEREELRLWLANRIWTSISSKEIFEFRHALPFLTDEGLKYYLPAFMLQCIKDGDLDTTWENIAFTLEDANPELWNMDQRHVICKWMRVWKFDAIPELFQKALNNFKCE